MTLKNNLLIKAAWGEKTERTPVWVMRQAGRILPEYLAIRNRLANFKELVTNPELAAEVTIQPVNALEVDAAIIFSDILVIPDAMGLPYEMVEKRGPVFPKTIRQASDLSQIKIADPSEDLSYVTDAIKIVKRELNGRVPLIGFAGAPWTIFSYMTEGSGSKTFSKSRRLLYTEPEMSHNLLDMITESTIRYLNKQIEVGADIVQVFDSWAGILGPDQYQTFSIPYLSRICDAIRDVPVIVFTKGAFFARKDISQLSCSVIGLDWNMSAKKSRVIIGNDKTLQGNLDPCALYGSFDEIKTATRKMLSDFGPDRHIANLGHGVYPDTKKDHVKCFIDTVKEESAKMRFQLN
jgi:uroporphyrinogen decarboxylase